MADFVMQSGLCRICRDIKKDKLSKMREGAVGAMLLSCDDKTATV